MAQLPLFGKHKLDSLIAYKNGKAITAGDFLAHAIALAKSLPEHHRAINLCEDRYYFLLGFVAALLRGQTTLLPPNRAHDTIKKLHDDYRHSYTLSDRPAEYKEFDCIDCTVELEHSPTDSIPSIAADHLCTILYTSGSSGEATPHGKTWGMLVHSAHLTGKQLAIPTGCNLLSTVPPQHMFGLESSVMLSLQYGCTIDNQRPLFPADIASALDSLPLPRVLITTPLQLRACAEAKQTLPSSSFILSATAPLTAELAQQIETLSDTTVKEIYGSTETGAIATRTTATEDRWRPLPGVIVEEDNNIWQMRAAHLPSPQPLADRLQYDGEGFILLGRSKDLIKVAGKRVSIGELNHALLTIDGVKDGAFFLPEESSDGNTRRLAAVVATDTLSKERLIEILRCRIDTAFLPRPLMFIDKLPRSETGKLPRHQLLALIDNRTQTN